MEIRLRTSYRLRDRELLRKLMDHPGCGTPYSIRTLAEAAGCSRSFVGHLLSGERDGCDEDIATSMSEALGVRVRVLFDPPPSPKPNDSTTTPNPPA